LYLHTGVKMVLWNHLYRQGAEHIDVKLSKLLKYSQMAKSVANELKHLGRTLCVSK
jgi:altronate dehydratase